MCQTYDGLDINFADFNKSRGSGKNSQMGKVSRIGLPQGSRKPRI